MTDRPEIGAWLAEAVRQHRAGDLSGAELIYTRILILEPGRTDALHLSGLIAHQIGRSRRAIAWIGRAIAVNGRIASFHGNLADALQADGQLDRALAAYQSAITLKADYGEVHCNQGNLLLRLGRTDEALESYRRAILDRPDFAEALYNQGNAHLAAGRPERAAACFRQAIIARSHLAAACCNLGTALETSGRLGEAQLAYVRAILLRPDDSAALFNLANALRDIGRSSEAIRLYRRAIEINPDSASAWSNLLLAMHYPSEVGADDIARAAMEAARRLETKCAPLPLANGADPDRRLRIGYVSADLRQHSVACFFEPLLDGRDAQQVELFCYAGVAKADQVTVRLRGKADHWRDVAGLDDEGLAALIREDGIDILVDLAGHTAGNRLAVFARKPAPIQVSWLGYPGSTGLRRIDYRLVDQTTDPMSPQDALYSEALWRLDQGFLCYRPDDAAPPPADRAATGATVSFGSFNHPAKLSRATLDCWAALLEAVPNAGLILKGPCFADSACRDWFRQRTRSHFPDSDRMTLIGHLPTMAAHLALYRQIDIALDPFPYNGTTTTCEALWMGVPVVTLRGERHSARVGASLLSRVGLGDLIAPSVEDYVRIAAALAAEPDRRELLRRSLRPRMATSSLCDARAFARSIESAYRAMWLRHCSV